MTSTTPNPTIGPLPICPHTQFHAICNVEIGSDPKVFTATLVCKQCGWPMGFYVNGAIEQQLRANVFPLQVPSHSG